MSIYAHERCMNWESQAGTNGATTTNECAPNGHVPVAQLAGHAGTLHQGSSLFDGTASI